MRENGLSGPPPADPTIAYSKVGVQKKYKILIYKEKVKFFKIPIF
jgi:hypothetical protein